MSEPELYPDDLLYHPEHDWARITSDTATLGVTWFAQEQLGEIVFWDPPAVGAQLVKDEPYSELESVKAVSDVVAPMSGSVLEVNSAVTADPTLVNSSPYGDGWLVRVRLTEPAEGHQLLDAAAYRELVQ
jgi:glycine cleavage system H protein